MSSMMTYNFTDNLYLSEFVQHMLNNNYTVRIYKKRPIEVGENPDDVETLVEVYKNNEKPEEA